MAKEKGNKVSLTGYDPVEEPEMVIESDKNTERKDAFREAYKKIMKIVPEYFQTQKKKRKNASGGGFSQNIIVTPENVKIENIKDAKVVEENEKVNERERE